MMMMMTTMTTTMMLMMMKMLDKYLVRNYGLLRKDEIISFEKKV